MSNERLTRLRCAYLGVWVETTIQMQCVAKLIWQASRLHFDGFLHVTFIFRFRCPIKISFETLNTVSNVRVGASRKTLASCQLPQMRYWTFCPPIWNKKKQQQLTKRLLLTLFTFFLINKRLCAEKASHYTDWQQTLKEIVKLGNWCIFWLLWCHIRGEIGFQKMQHLRVAKALINSYILCNIWSF